MPSRKPPRSKKRGAATPRSSFRATNKTKPIAKKAATPAKKNVVAKRANAKPAKRANAAKPDRHAKPARHASAKPAKQANAAKPDRHAKPAERGRTERKTPAPATPPTREKLQAASTPGQIPLGEITIPSGRLAIFDVGLVGYLPRPALEPAIVKANVPPDRPLRVVGVPIGKGRFGNCWDYVAVELAQGDAHSAKKLGEAGVDFARLVCMDHAALDHWQHEDSLDGKADFVFWGRDEAQLARAMGARRQVEGYGWIDLAADEAERKADDAARLKSQHGWAFAADLRPHTHHYYALAEARRGPHGAGTLDLAGTRLLLFFTSWGDGVFPIYLDLDGDDRPVRVRIQLATAESNAAMAAVNP